LCCPSVITGLSPNPKSMKAIFVRTVENMVTSRWISHRRGKDDGVFGKARCQRSQIFMSYMSGRWRTV
jgi:hypothetical protein